MTRDPILSAPVGGGALRFFPPPHRRGPDLPWIALDDLQRCLGFPADVRERMLRALSEGGWRGEATTLASGGEIVTVVPHFMAQGLIESCCAAGLATPQTDCDYHRAAVGALKALVATLPPERRPIYALEAMAAGLRREPDGDR